MKSIIALALLLVLATTVFSRRIGGFGGYQTARYPSDSDVYGKAIPFLAEDEEDDEESDILYATKRYPSDSDNVISTRAYPSDSDFSFDDDEEEEDNEESDLSLLYTTMKYPSDNGNNNGAQTKKYPSDSDFATTMMYPSDGDFNRVALAADEEEDEDEEADLSEFFKKFKLSQKYVTKAYPSDSDIGQIRKPLYLADEEDDDEEADLSPIFNSKPVSRAYPSDWDIGMQTKKYPSDADAKKVVAFDDEEDDEESDFFDKLKLGKLPRSVSMAYPSDTDPMQNIKYAFDDQEEADDDEEEADLSPIFTTKKYPSDYDNTLSFTKAYPSDSDAKLAFDDEEDEEESEILKFTKAYPSDSDMNNRRFFAFAKDAAEEEDDEEADLSPIFTTMKYPSDYDNTLQFTKAYPSDTDIGLQTMKYPSDSDANKLAFDDEEDSE